MKNKLILLSLVSVFAYSSQKEITIRVENREDTFVNGIKSYCECGRSPVMAMILFGRLDLYCEEHLPEVEKVQRLTPERLAEILRKD